MARSLLVVPHFWDPVTANAKEVETFFDTYEFIDYFLIGEGEESFLDILEDPELPRSVIDPNRALSLSQIKTTALKMDDQPLRDYGYLPLHRYLQLSVSSARGCPFECSFVQRLYSGRGLEQQTTKICYEEATH